ncbi:endo-beta-N-acetylglucosaminidase [Brachybacterium hainanense]|uniref:Cytosolic endo-beta-N-acetylglucosaminidase TIM barrel domain-containing protein n=1 Tax=Brachybacterium hainanense TaxID=1541174 RepID=A0ABV6RAA6_9MICO
MSAVAAAVGAVPYLPGSPMLTPGSQAAGGDPDSIAPLFREWPREDGEGSFAFYLDSRTDLDEFLAFDYRNADLAHHRSFVPRARRVSDPSLLAAHPELDARPQVADFSEFYSFVEHGADGFTYAHDFRAGNARDVQVPRFHQYRDLVSYWQVFTAVPNAALTDVVHRNGGRCLAFMFNSGPTNFSRDAMLRQDPDGSFPVGDRLVDLAAYFGFDGYMFDMEEGVVDSADKPLLLAMFQSMHERARESGFEIHLQIYGPNPDGRSYADWQSISQEQADYLTTPDAADSWFLDYSWSDYLGTTVDTLAVTDIDPFGQVFFGIELEGFRGEIGVDTTRSPLAEAIPPHGSSLPLGSTALFSLTAETTRRVHAELKDAHGGELPDFEEVRHAVYRGERRFWSGPHQNPALPADGPIGLYGMADYVHARSAVAELPFLTRFNTGASDQFSLAGRRSSAEPWYNLGIQDLLPTWQFWTRNLTTGEPATGPLDVDYDLGTAFDGGASLAITGTPQDDDGVEIRLFRTELELPAESWASLTYTSGSVAHLSLGLVFEDDPDTTTWHDLDVLPQNDDFGPTWGYGSGGRGWGRGGWVPSSSWAAGWRTIRAGSDWQQAVIGLGGEEGRTIIGVSLAVTAPAGTDVDLRIGELAVSANGLQEQTPAAPTGLVLEDSRLRPDGASAEARLIWDVESSVAYYDVLRSGSAEDPAQLVWLGRITADRCYLQTVPVRDGEASVELLLRATAPNGRTSEPAAVTMPVA